MTTSLPAPLAALTWLALGFAMLFVGAVTLGIPSYADVLFGFLPDFAFQRGPLIGLELAFGICLEVLLFVTGVLVGYILFDKIFCLSALRWVDVLIVAAVEATVLVFATLFFIPGPPQLFLAMAGAAVVCVAIVLVFLVLRSLLRRAVSINIELDEVV